MTSKQQKRLDKLVVAIEDWRRSKERLSARMPDALWAEAAAIAGQLGIGIVRKRAGLEHSKLKRLCQGASEALSLTTFVEIPAPPPSAISCAIEIESRGARMRATVNGVSAEQVATIFREFAS